MHERLQVCLKERHLNIAWSFNGSRHVHVCTLKKLQQQHHHHHLFAFMCITNVKYLQQVVRQGDPRKPPGL